MDEYTVISNIPTDDRQTLMATKTLTPWNQMLKEEKTYNVQALLIGWIGKKFHHLTAIDIFQALSRVHFYPHISTCSFWLHSAFPWISWVKSRVYAHINTDTPATLIIWLQWMCRSAWSVTLSNWRLYYMLDIMGKNNEKGWIVVIKPEVF